MNRDALRQLQGQLGTFAIAPPIATVTPRLERSIARPRLTPAVKRALALLVFLVGAALGVMLPAGCAIATQTPKKLTTEPRRSGCSAPPIGDPYTMPCYQITDAGKAAATLGRP